MSGVILAALIVGGTGLILGLFLGLADKKFKVEVDEKEALIRAELPGNNCGGCGYAGCDAVAKAIAEGEADVDVCPVGGAEAAAKIASIMGKEASTTSLERFPFPIIAFCPRSNSLGAYLSIRLAVVGPAEPITCPSLAGDGPI